MSLQEDILYAAEQGKTLSFDEKLFEKDTLGAIHWNTLGWALFAYRPDEWAQLMLASIEPRDGIIGAMGALIHLHPATAGPLCTVLSQYEGGHTLVSDDIFAQLDMFVTSMDKVQDQHRHHLLLHVASYLMSEHHLACSGKEYALACAYSSFLLYTMAGVAVCKNHATTLLNATHPNHIKDVREELRSCLKRTNHPSSPFCALVRTLEQEVSSFLMEPQYS